MQLLLCIMHSYRLADITVKMELVAYTKHVEDIVKNKTQKVLLVGSIMQGILKRMVQFRS